MKNLLCIIALAVLAASCNPANNSASMKGDENKARLQKFYDEVINAHNQAVIDSFCTAEFVDHNPDEGHSGKGIDDVKASFTEFFAAFPDIHISVNYMVAQGDTVMAHVTMSGTNTGAMGNMPATGKKVSIDGIDAIAFKDGKAVERWGFFDTMKMMQELGMMPPPGAMPDSSASKINEGKM